MSLSKTEANTTVATVPDSSSSAGYDDLASIPENDPIVQANLHELYENMYQVNVAITIPEDELDRQATYFIDQLDQANRDVNQTSEEPPFSMPRFLSQPSRVGKPSVSFADESVGNVGSGAKSTGNQGMWGVILESMRSLGILPEMLPRLILSLTRLRRLILTYISFH